MAIDEKMQLRATIGLNIGMALGMTAAFVAIVVSAMQLWYKIFAAFGIFCAICLQVAGVVSAYQRLNAYTKAMEEYKKLNTSTETTPYVG